MDRVFEALASTARRQILAYLSAGELTAGEIGERFDFSKPALSSHLRILEDAGLIEREKRGQYVYFRQIPDRLTNTLFAWAAEVCPVAGPLKRESRSRAKARTKRAD
jgi:ArsR family transcriptional regulator